MDHPLDALYAARSVLPGVADIVLRGPAELYVRGLHECHKFVNARAKTGNGNIKKANEAET